MEFDTGLCVIPKHLSPYEVANPARNSEKGKEDNVSLSARSTFNANEHNEVYAF